ncbi:hypothetical protein [Salimicrobium flavidum]|uniref:Lipoprotein n=1 Tax=Salimicrobium flavidum TaxID=570947 RepID=A0A1N7JAE0_9BACI|nr:hypothetical protein [Salimicrobium flavidum]SIS46234.1 hypothetical protein SAMN05421687_104260 [Salimicrobium flavidum]
MNNELHRTKKAWVLSLLLLSLFSGCMKSESNSEENYYFSLTGESETWEVDGYEMVVQQDEFKVGDGKITTKKGDGITADFFGMEVHAVHNGNDTIIHRKSSTGEDQNISQTETGSLEGGRADFSSEKDYAEQLEDVYMLVTWSKDGEEREETIDLYDG